MIFLLLERTSSERLPKVSDKRSIIAVFSFGRFVGHVRVIVSICRVSLPVGCYRHFMFENPEPDVNNTDNDEISAEKLNDVSGGGTTVVPLST